MIRKPTEIRTFFVKMRKEESLDGTEGRIMDVNGSHSCGRYIREQNTESINELLCTHQ